jgi:AcrR family transcriptional regulator
VPSETASPAPRTRILDAASEAFYRRGIAAVGVDAIVADAGVAKSTLYRHFPSKDDLIVAFLRRRDERWRAWLRAEVERLSPDPAERPLAVFDALGGWFASDGFRGCAFINAAAEIADPVHPARAAVQEHKRLCGEYLAELLRDAGRPGAVDEAAALLLLMEGAMVSALIERHPGPAARARAAAAAILDHPRPQEDR